MRPEIIRLYDDYTHARLARRDFLKRLAGLVGGTAAATALLPLLANDYAQAATVEATDARLKAGRVEFEVDDGAYLNGYIAFPRAAAGKLAAIVVVHENRGLNPHIEDIARRLAVAGHLAFAPDLLSRRGGTPDDEEMAREWIGKLDGPRVRADLVGALGFLARHARGSDRLGTLGFCWGGGQVARLATMAPQVKGTVVYYGAPPPVAEVANIKGALLGHYAGLDARINERLPEFEAALTAAGVRHALHTYAGVNHAFNNDTNAARYDKAAADLAWTRTLEFFARELA